MLTRSSTIGPESRPVAFPAARGSWSGEVLSGVIELPSHIWWSAPKRSFDLSNEKDRNRVYELVLTEGSEQDIYQFIDFDTLIRVWDELALPRYVRRAWDEWFKEANFDEPMRCPISSQDVDGPRRHH